MGLFGESDGDTGFTNADYGRMFGMLKFLGRTVNRVTQGARTAHQQAALKNAVEQMQHNQNQAQPKQAQGSAELPAQAIARPNLTPLQPKRKS